MKKLKLTINDEVKTFDLPEDGEYKCEVTETYVPKAGNCVMLESKDTGKLYWCKITSVTATFANFNIAVKSNLKTYENGFFEISDNRIYTKITPEELKAKYAEAGYDWDYESDTIKSIKWVPKDGDEVWGIDIFLKPYSFIYNSSEKLILKSLEKGLLFPTEAECQKFAEHCMEYIK